MDAHAAGSAATPRSWRPRRTSAASRPCRTRSSTPAPSRIRRSAGGAGRVALACRVDRRRHRLRPGTQPAGGRPGQHARSRGGGRRAPADQSSPLGWHQDPRRLSRRSRAPDVRARIAWLLARLTVVLSVVDIAGHLRLPHARSPRRRWRSTASRSSNGAVVGCAVLGSGHRLPRRAARRRLAARPGRAAPARSRCCSRPTASGWSTRPGPGRAARGVRLGLFSALIGGQLRDRHAGPAVPAGARRAAAVAALEIRRLRRRHWASCAALSQCVREPDDIRHRGCRRRAGPRADLHRRLRVDQRRAGRLRWSPCSCACAAAAARNGSRWP